MRACLSTTVPNGTPNAPIIDICCFSASQFHLWLPQRQRGTASHQINVKKSSHFQDLLYCALTFSLSCTSAACCFTDAPACAACSAVIFSLYLLPLLHFASRTSHTPLPHFLSCNFCFSIISIAVSSWHFNLR